MLAQTPKPPYFAVIFSSTRTPGDNGYGAMADKMVELAAKQPGYLGIESARDENLGITVSYWRSEADIAHWKKNAEHQVAQKLGKSKWYGSFALRVAKVERESFKPDDGPNKPTPRPISTSKTSDAVVEVDDVRAWIEQDSSIHLKTIDPYGDPVELTAKQALELAAALVRMAKQIEH